MEDYNLRHAAKVKRRILAAGSGPVNARDALLEGPRVPIGRRARGVDFRRARRADMIAYDALVESRSGRSFPAFRTAPGARDIYGHAPQSRGPQRRRGRLSGALDRRRALQPVAPGLRPSLFLAQGR